MYKEDYVSFEVAKLLEGKGYKEPCEATYYPVYKDKKSELHRHINNLVRFDELDKASLGGMYNEYLAPSLYDAQKWLREKHDIDVIPILKDGEYIKQYYCLLYVYGDIKHTGISNKSYDSYEEALNEGIKETLKYI